MKKIVIAVVVGLVAAVGWFLFSPLVIETRVDESFPIGNAQPGADRIARVSAMESASAPMPTMQSEPVLIARGSFADADAVHKGTGDALLYRLPDGRHVLRFEDFRVTNGPDLHVYLAARPGVRKAADVTDDGFHDLGALKGSIGNQNYELPADLDPGEWRSVVIWCELFGVLFSPATFEPV